MARRAGKNLKMRVAVGALALSGLFAGLAQVFAQPAPIGPNRLALVIGEASYATGPLSSAANDAGLIAQTLQQAGFDVTGAADLDQDGLRKTLREFVDKASAAGPDATVFIYLSGRGVQYEGENYLAPIDARIPAAANVPLEAVRLSDYLTPLAQMPLKARIVVLDAARADAFAQQGQPLAGGLALVEPPPGELIAFNAAPGTVAPNETGPYGVYAQALNEMLRQGGVPVDQTFDATRLRVAQQTQGAQIPWDESKLSPAPVLFGRAAGAPAAVNYSADLRARPIRDYGLEQAYAAALERDDIAGYSEFLAAFPDSPYAARVRALLAVRREALTWRRAWQANTPAAYWTYLRRYPNGPHAEDARLRLGALSAQMGPPPGFVDYAFDVPPPPQDDYGYFRHRWVEFDEPYYGAPPPMMGILPPPLYVEREPPPPPPHHGLLPLPLAVAPLLFAIPAVRQGLFHAPAHVQAQYPGAQPYYDGHKGPPPPAGAPAPVPPLHPGSPLPHPGGAPTPQPPAPAVHPAPASPPPPVPAPHVAPPAPPPPPHVAPRPAPVEAPLHQAPPVHVAPPPAPHVAPPPPPPHVAPPPPPPHLAPPPPPREPARPRCGAPGEPPCR